jgi:uncharacterized protein (TIGR00369 family)
MENKALKGFKDMLGENSKVKTLSPLGRWLDGILLKAEAGQLKWKFVVRQDMTNPGNVLHGGATAAMIDDVMGATVFSLGLPNFYTSINLSIDYLSSAKVGDELTVEATVVRQGRNVIHITSEVKRGDKLIAKASSNMIIVAS